MFGILNDMFRTSTGTKSWNAPTHWQERPRLSAFERQERDAARQRMFLIRDRDQLR